MMQHLDLIRQNFIAKASYFARWVPGMSVEETPDFVLVDSGLPSDTFNTIIIKSDNFGAGKSVLQYYMDQNFPAAFWLWETPHSNKTEQQLIDLQLLINEMNMGMWVDLKEVKQAFSNLPDFKIKPVIKAEEFEAYTDTLAGLFEPTDEAIQIRKYYQLIFPYYQAKNSKMQFFIGENKEQVVATGTLFFDGDTVGIYDVATLENVRGKGFGSQMFGFLLQTAKSQGAQKAFLQASPDGLGIYKRAGFKEIGAVKVFENRHLLK